MSKGRKNYQTKMSSNLPDGTLKKRSAFEDLTNASHSQLAKLKEEANKQFAKGASRKIKRSTPTLGLTKDNELNIKRYKLETLPTVAHTTWVSNIMEKPFILEITMSQTPTTEEAPFFKKTVFKEESTTKETPLIKRPLSLKKYMNQEVSLLKQPLSLHDETDSEAEFLVPIISRQKDKTKDSVITRSALFLKKEICTNEWKQSTWEEFLALQDKINIEGESCFIEPVNVRKKPKSEEAITTKKLSFKKKHTTQAKMPHLKQPLLLLKTTYGEKSLISESLSFRKKPAPELASLFQDPSVPPKTHAFPEEASFSNKQFYFQEKTTSEEESHMKEPLTFKEKSTTEEKILFQKPFSLLEKRSNKGKSIFQEPLFLQEKTDIKKSLKELLASEEVLTYKEELLIKESLTLTGKSTMVKEFLFQKPLSLQKNSTNKDSLFQQSLPLPEKSNTKDLFFLKKLLALKKETIHEENSLYKNPWDIKKMPFVEVTALRERGLSLNKNPTSQEELFLLNNWLVLQKNITKEEKSHLTQLKVFQEKHNIERETLLQETLAVQDSSSIEKTKLWKLDLQEKPTLSPTQEHTVDIETQFKESLALQEEPRSQKEKLVRGSLDFQEKTPIEKEVLLKKTLVLSEETAISEAFFLKNTLALEEKPIIGEEFSFKDHLHLQESTAIQENIFLTALRTLQGETNPHLFSTATQSVKGNTATMYIADTSNICESSCKESSPREKIAQKEQMASPEYIDKDHGDPLFNSIYAKDIFNYMKEREEKFIIKNYMNIQTDINSDMRAILVDWLVEVQMTFKMSHETLYLAVKLVDHYLMEVVFKRDKLQLLGSTAFLIAAKFEETCPPSVADILYICDDVYQRHEVLAMETSILKTLNFDINIPTAYHFLRRYAKCLHANMKTLTLSRYICEMTLQEYDYIQERASKLAASSFLLALYMRKLDHWVPTLEYCSGYKISDLYPLVRQLNSMLTFQSCDSNLKTVYSKYSLRIYFEVTKMPPLGKLNLEKILN
ncbi:G2/mitotic-specific cyclin-B3 [Tenrec ecaudatus]|uniref:G2/mitotic-specific cyclin-B3 n=1 Tax=Tenrec ecaudatus TaxID=94439 RepID=UPI003F5A2C0A